MTLRWIFASLFFCQAIFGQENFVRGYIVSLENDTLKGWIDYRNWGLNPSEVCFKQKNQRSKQCYAPWDIRSFGVAKDHYESAIVKAEISLSATAKLSIDSTFM